jgi:hypothetical protein
LANRKLGIGVSFTATALALSAAYAGGCVSSTSGGPDAGTGGDDGGGTSSSSSSGGIATSSGSSGGTTGDATGSSSGSTSGGGTPLTPDPTGYVSVTGLGIQGAWYAYGDNWGTTGMPPGVCEMTGMHPTTACSTITSPLPGMVNDEGGVTATFPQTTPGTMCLSGTAAKVVACVAGVAGCTGSDYSNIFGIGIGLDFNNTGGVKMPYNATMNKVTGFTFTLSGVPTAGIRVEFPTTDTTTTGSDSYAFSKGGSVLVTADGTYTADMTTAATDPHPLADSFTPPATLMQPAFNAAHLLSIQFHVPTNTTAAIPVTNLCVSNLTAIVSP